MNSFIDIAVEIRESDWKRYMKWVLSESIGEDEIRAGYEREESACKLTGRGDLTSSIIPDVFR